MPNGIIIIDKPAGWTASELALKERKTVNDPAVPDGRLLLFTPHPLRWAAVREKEVCSHA